MQLYRGRIQPEVEFNRARIVTRLDIEVLRRIQRRHLKGPLAMQMNITDPRRSYFDLHNMAQVAGPLASIFMTEHQFISTPIRRGVGQQI